MKQLFAFFLSLSFVVGVSSAQAQQQNLDSTSVPTQPPQAQSASWMRENSGVIQQLANLSFPSRDTAFVFAGGGVGALRSIDGGVTWQPLATPELGFFRFFSSSIGYLASYSGHTAYHTSDGGQHWASVDDSDQLVSIVYPITPDTCFLTGSTFISRTTDAGKTWKVKELNAAGINAIAFADSKHGIVVGDVQPGPLPHQELTAGCFTTSNGGETWVQQYTGSSSDFQAACFLSRDTILSIGLLSKIYRSIDGAKSWQLVDTLFTGAHLYDVANHRNVVYVVGMAGTILGSTDAGATWEFQNSGVTDDLHSVAAFDDMLAIAIGLNGTILKTTNGGTDWVQIAPPSNADLQPQTFPEPSPGQVQFTYRLPQLQDVTIAITDVTGRMIATVVDHQLQTSGQHTVPFDGIRLPPGVYTYTIQTERYQASGKFTLVR